MNMKQSLFIAFSFLLVSCGAPIVTPTSTPTTEPPTPTTPRPSVTPRPTYTPLSTSTLAEGTTVVPISSFSAEAQEYCGNAYGGGGLFVPGAGVFPVLGLMKAGSSGSEEWHRFGLPFYEAQSSAEIQTLLCIVESEEITGSYLDGTSAITYIWDVWLVKWPEQNRLSSTKLKGGSPPFIKHEPGPGYGSRPVTKLHQWLYMFTSVVTGAKDSLFSPDGRMFITWQEYYGDSIRAIEVGTFQELYTICCYSYLSEVLFSPDGSLIAARVGNTIVLWDAATGLELRTFSMAMEGLGGFQFSPDGRRLVAFFMDQGLLILWDVSTGQETSRFLVPGLRNAVFSPDARTLAAWAWNGSGITVGDVSSGQVIRELEHPSLEGAVYSPDGAYLASWNETSLMLWEASSGRLLFTYWDVYLTRSAKVIFSPDSQFLVGTGVGGESMFFWDTDSGQEIWIQAESAFRFDEYGGFFLPDQDILVTLLTSWESDLIKIWAVASGHDLNTLPHKDVDSLAISPDGKYLISWTTGRSAVLLWDVTTGQLLTTFQVPEITRAFFSPDGAYLVTVVDETARFWKFPDEILSK